ncbi:O-antigen ligase family protein [Sphingopyxis sp. L1A2A]|uniref:O-antigen ligase family protein n=1 Tax=Sphingopyxis sp. L1A2A TaxID=2502247 RepID=UPI001484D77D|nr:O-antigen ligase family protein [Sphingopyxis sp. L1A2A]
MLAAFVVIIALMGGSSRSDVASLPFLRAFVVLLAFAALVSTPAAAWRSIRIPLLLLAALAVWMVVQLIPLPSDVWRGLPNRDIVFKMDELLGHGDRWRPISLTPSLTLNSLLSLVVPFGALLVAAAAPAEQRERLWWLVWGFAVVSSAFALMQFVAGPRSVFYLYRITNEEGLVGLFANRNHQAFLLALAIVAAGWLIVKEMSRKQRKPLIIAALGSSIALFFVLILITGSRLGLLCGTLALILTFVVIRWGYRFRHQPVNQLRTAKSARWDRVVRIALTVAPIVIVAVVGLISYLSGRASSVTRMLGSSGDAAAEMRLEALSTVTELLRGQWLWGSGFGSFAKVFQIVEPDALLRPTYFNHAHNDWLQFPIEGGLPAVLVALAAIGWLAWSILAALRKRPSSGGIATIEQVALSTCFVFLAIGSLVDYPLRQPSLMMVVAFLVVILVRARSDGDRLGKRD